MHWVCFVQYCTSAGGWTNAILHLTTRLQDNNSTILSYNTLWPVLITPCNYYVWIHINTICDFLNFVVLIGCCRNTVGLSDSTEFQVTSMRYMQIYAHIVYTDQYDLKLLSLYVLMIICIYDV